MKITIIGGGNMGGALALGLAQGSIFRAEDITVTARTQDTLCKIETANPLIRTSLDNVSAVEDADYIILAVKPWLIGKVIEEIVPCLDITRQVIISVAAGITFDELTRMLGGGTPTLFRVIPNTAIAIRQSMTLVAACHASKKQIWDVLEMMDELGKSILIEEKLMSAGTALTSCGIAYALQYIKAAMQGAIELGLYPQQAKEMILQTLQGAVGLLQQGESLPEEEIYKVCTPGGVTIKGLNAMTANGFDHAVIEGLKKAAGK